MISDPTSYILLYIDQIFFKFQALQNTKLLHTYACIDKRALILGYAIKVFAKVCDIGDASKGSLSSYAYMLLMFHYLQQTKPPVIPVLQEVIWCFDGLYFMLLPLLKMSSKNM